MQLNGVSFFSVMDQLGGCGCDPPSNELKSPVGGDGGEEFLILR